MSVRVVARVRPLLKSESEHDVIVRSEDGQDASQSLIKIPNPKNVGEDFTFHFNSVYGQDSTQQEIFDSEVTPTVKHLFLGYDVTLFAYGSTGTGKTHTMRGGKSMADRGMIPRLLSSIYRKSRALEKSSDGQTSVEVSMSYYEIYNDRVFDLFEPPELRTATGLPIREAEGGKTVVVGLSELPCGSLKEFEVLYDKANSNRSTGATKLNAHSSRSHAILCVKVTITSPAETRVSTASAIDLAGSEDNRRTGNGKDRMVESASINKSLFVLAQCVEAISKKQQRIPYRESKMTRILSLGQNNGFTVMILNLAPVKSYHLDTLSSLNFANRTKRIEVREVENEPIFKGPPRQPAGTSSVTGATIQRQPLRPLANGINLNLGPQRDAATANGKPSKAFSVYSDKTRLRTSGPPIQIRPSHVPQKSSPMKRPAESTFTSTSRPSKISRSTPLFIRRGPAASSVLTTAAIESVVEKKVCEILAARAMNAPEPAVKDISDAVQQRLDSIEQRLAGQEGERAEGLSYLLMAKQHQARGEDSSALKMYQLAQPYFPGNEKLEGKITRLREKVQQKLRPGKSDSIKQRQARDDMEDYNEGDDDSYHDDGESIEGDTNEDDDSFHARLKNPKSQKALRRMAASSYDPPEDFEIESTPRTRRLLDVVNSRDVNQLKLLNGLGAKRAEGIIEGLREWDEMYGARRDVTSWQQLGRLKGIGAKTLETMRVGVMA